jgi:hypothetical protein
LLLPVVDVVPVAGVPVVPIVLSVPDVPVPDVPEVSVEVIMSELVVPVVLDMVLVVDDAAVSVETVSVAVFSCFLQANANSATASKAINVTERDFFIANSPKVQSETTGGLTAGRMQADPAHVALY